MAHATVPTRREPPPVGRTAPVRVTAGFRDDLAILMRNGRSLTDVIRAAVRTLADAHRYAWEWGDIPEDTDPDITGAQYRGQTLPCGHTVGRSQA